MSDNSSIAWTDATWNVVTGCTKVSEGCRNCYITRTPPFRMQHRGWDRDGLGATTGVQLHPDRLSQPYRWRKPRRVFVCSLADLFHSEVPDDHIVRVWAAMATTERHTYQILTKRPARMRALLRDPGFRSAVASRAGQVMEDGDNWRDYVEFGSAWPLPNVWGGVTVEDQDRADQRIPMLLDTPLAVRWVSVEPMLGPVDLAKAVREYRTRQLFLSSTGIDWVVVGGESGPGARPMHPDWARGLRDQCQAAGVPFHFKQWGAWAPTGNTGVGVHLTASCKPDPTYCYAGPPYSEMLPSGRTGFSPEMHRVGSRLAGRLLDGRTWDQYPEATR